MKDDKKLLRGRLYVRDVYWFRKRAEINFNSTKKFYINENLFTNDKSFREKLRGLHPYYRIRYSETASKLKTESKICVKF